MPIPRRGFPSNQIDVPLQPPETGAQNPRPTDSTPGSARARSSAESAEASRAGAARSSLQRLRWPQRRSVQCRQEPHVRRSDHGHQARKEERGCVEPDHACADSGEAGGTGDARHSRCNRGSEEEVRVGQKRARGEKQTGSHCEAAESTGGRQEHAFNSELTDDASAAGADRGTNGDFAPTADRFRDKQVCQVHARDQQHEPDGAKDDDGCAPNVHQRAPRPRTSAGRPETFGTLDTTRRLRDTHQGPPADRARADVRASGDPHP